MADTIRFTIPGRLPGLNEYTKANRTNKHVGAKMKEDTELIVTAYIKAAKLKTVKPPVIIHYRWFEPHRKRDLDNIAFAKKFIQDALVRSNVLANDGWFDIAGYSDEFSVDKANPRVEIVIQEIEAAYGRGEMPKMLLG